MADFTVTCLHPTVDEDGHPDAGASEVEYHGDDTFKIEDSGVLVVSTRADGLLTRVHVAPHAWKSVSEATRPDRKPRVMGI